MLRSLWIYQHDAVNINSCAGKTGIKMNEWIILLFYSSILTQMWVTVLHLFWLEAIPINALQYPRVDMARKIIFLNKTFLITFSFIISTTTATINDTNKSNAVIKLYYLSIQSST